MLVNSERRGWTPRPWDGSARVLVGGERWCPRVWRFNTDQAPSPLLILGITQLRLLGSYEAEDSPNLPTRAEPVRPAQDLAALLPPEPPSVALDGAKSGMPDNEAPTLLQSSSRGERVWCFEPRSTQFGSASPVKTRYVR